MNKPFASDQAAAKVCPTCGATMSAECDTSEELAEAPKKESHFAKATRLIKDRQRKRKTNLM